MTVFKTDLFIGGCADGTRIPTENTPNVEVPVLSKFRAVPEGEDAMFAPQETHTYVREVFACDVGKRHTEFVFYRWEKLDLVTCVASLFGGYHPQHNTKRS